MNYRSYRLGISIFILLLGLYACGRKPGISQEENGQATLSIESTNTSAALPVEVMVVHRDKVQQKISFTGVLEPLYSVDIVAEVSGRVERIIKDVGDRVILEDTLAVIDDRVSYSQFKQAESQILSAKNNLKISQLNLRSDEELFHSGDISELAYESARLAVKTAEANHLSAIANYTLMEKNYRDTRIMSPIRGKISRRYVNKGTMVMQNMTIFRVVDLSVLKMKVGVSQGMINRVYIGSQADVSISALGNSVFSGVVKHISPQADENTGSFIVEIYIKNTQGRKILAGMTGKANLVLTELENRLSIPDHALVNKNGMDYVYRIIDGKAKLILVSISEQFGSSFIVNEGLADGDTIVVVGMKNLGVDTRVVIEQIN